MSTVPERALALAGAMPLHLGVLGKPFRLEQLRASIERAAHGHRVTAQEPSAA
jgi:hypothetical protein